MNDQRLTAALELIGILAERFPAAFAIKPYHRRPLKLGIHIDILARLSDTITPRDLSTALRVYVGNIGYLKALVTGADRVDLEGMPAGMVTAEHASIAKAQYEQRRDKHKAKQKQQAPTNGAGKPEPQLTETVSGAAVRRLSFSDLRMAAQARRVALP